MKRFILYVDILGCLFGAIYMYKLSNHPDRLIDGTTESYLIVSGVFALLTLFFLTILLTLKMTVTWDIAKNYLHDISGIGNPEKYRYEKINGIYYPILD